MAIDPTAPVSPGYAALPVGGAPADAAAALLARARAVTAETATVLGALAAGDGKAVEGAGIKAAPGPVLDPATGQVPVAETVRTTVRQAAARAAPHQAGLAPLLSDVSDMAAHPQTPPAVREAARALIRAALPTDRPVTPTRLREAVRRSGAFLEADLARMGGADPDRGAGRAAQTPSAADLGRDLKAGLLVFRSVVSTWLGDVQEQAQPSADLSPDPAPDLTRTAHDPARPAPSSGLATTAPYGMKVSAAPLPAAALPVAEPAVRPPDLSVPVPRATGTALSAASALISAQMAATPAAAGAPPAQAISPGAGPARGLVETPDAGPESVPATDAEALPAAGEPREAADARPQPSGRGTPVTPGDKPGPASPARLQEGELPDPEPILPGDPEEAELARRTGQGAAGGPAPGRTPPPPPFPGGPMTPQPAHPASLRPDMPAPDLARHLLREAGGAIDRQTLMQIASMPDPVPARAGEAARPAEAAPARVMFDLPLQTPQGIAVAQFEISRDGGGGGGAGGPSGERTWRARFSLDVEPLGPVHVQIALTGVQTRVSLWAERPEAMARLIGGEETLSAALRQADLTPELAFHAGVPPVQAGSTGLFVDRAS
jgi:hypothetical protein